MVVGIITNWNKQIDVGIITNCSNLFLSMKEVWVMGQGYWARQVMGQAHKNWGYRSFFKLFPISPSIMGAH